MDVPAELTVIDVKTPGSLAELASLVAECEKSKSAVFPAGGGTMLDRGWPASRPGILIELGRIQKVDDYPAEDMTITVEAGIRLGELDRILAEKNQMLPVDVPLREQATLGGAIATNSSGPRRFGCGTFRDYVLGIDVISPQGTRVHGGGRVVKNVAGYDLMKLHTGALGTLGIIGQVTLKLRPLPEVTAVASFPLERRQIDTILDKIVVAPIRPVAIELYNREASARLAPLPPAPDWQCSLLFEESSPAIAWQLDRLRALAREWGVGEIAVDSAPYEVAVRALADWPIGKGSPSNLFVQATVPSSKVGDFCEHTENQLPGAEILAHAGNGIITVGLSARDPGATEIDLAHCAHLAEQVRGSLVILKCPFEWKSRLPIWGRERPDWRYMRGIQDALDPANIMNPGRFVTGRSHRDSKP